MNKHFITRGKTPEAFITKGKQRLKQYGDTVYLNNGDEFQFEIFNPIDIKILTKIELNGKSISNNGLVVRPGERVFLERFIDDNNKFLFETYNVDNNNEVKNIIEKNGNVKISFYRQYEPAYYNTLIYSSPITYYDYNKGTEGGLLGTVTCSNTTSTYTSDTQLSYTNTENTIETGRVEQGNVSNQKFSADHSQYEYYPMSTVTWKILPESQKELTSDDIKQYCSVCGRRKRKGENYCPHDGHKF